MSDLQKALEANVQRPVDQLLRAKLAQAPHLSAEEAFAWWQENLKRIREHPVPHRFDQYTEGEIAAALVGWIVLLGKGWAGDFDYFRE